MRQYVGPATPPASRVGLPLAEVKQSDPLYAKLLPAGLAPARRTDGRHYVLPVPVPRGAFGLRSEAPIEDRASLNAASTAIIFLAGGLCSSTAHSLLVPLDVVKTRMQVMSPDCILIAS